MGYVRQKIARRFEQEEKDRAELYEVELEFIQEMLARAAGTGHSN